MAKIGNIPLGGHNTVGISGAPMLCGVAFDLVEKAPTDFTYTPDGTLWEVELRAGQSKVVARTALELERTDVLSAGLEWTQRCLDLLSFEQRSDTVLATPGDTHLLLFVRDRVLVLQHVVVSSLGVSVNVEAIVKDKDGNVKAQAPPPVVWTPGLRYYRLSQASRDLYEAYRNLFLGLEALLDTICPKTPKEREREWLLRAISEVGKQVNLKHFVPSGINDPPAYIVRTQYNNIRCRLFHAKAPSAGNSLNIIPKPEEVALAYKQLVKLWRQIAQDCLLARRGSGGGMTYVGFKMMMDNALSNKLSMYFTQDPSPAKKADTKVSPLGKKIYPFRDVAYHGETAPGRVSFLGSHPISKLDNLPIVHRICAKTRDALMTACCIEEGLEMSDVDVFESLQTIRLRNRDLPKIAFGD
jgi:hypothetical protein